MRTNFLKTMTAAGALLCVAGAAQALPVEIQFKQTGGSLPGTSSIISGSGSADFSGKFGNWTIGVLDTGTPPEAEPLLSTTTLNTSTTCATSCQLQVWITETGLTWPVPKANFYFNPDWLKVTGDISSVYFNYWVSSANTPFGGTEIKSFQANAATNGLFLPPVLGVYTGSEYSESIEYVINVGSTTSCGSAKATVCTANLSTEITAQAPEPASLSLLGSALIAMGAFSRRRRRKAG